MRRRLLAAAALTSAALLTAPLLGPLPAGADPAQPAVVSANPVDNTPHVLDGTVWALTVVGDTVVVGDTDADVGYVVLCRRHHRAGRPFAPRETRSVARA